MAARVRAELHERVLPVGRGVLLRCGDGHLLGLRQGQRHLRREDLALPGGVYEGVGHLGGRRLRLGQGRGRARVHASHRRSAEARHDPAGPDVRVPADEEALFTLRPGHRVRHVRHGQGAFGEGVRHLRGHRRSRQVRYHPVRTRPDAAHLRRAELPLHGHPAASAGQRRRGRRRRERAARRAERAGRHRHGHARGEPARLPELAHRVRHAVSAQMVREGDVRGRLLHQQAEVHRLRAEGMVRRRGHGGERLRLRLVAEGAEEPRLLHHRLVRADEPGYHQGLLQLGHEPLPLGAEREQRAPRHGEPRLARGGRLGGDGVRHLLEGPRHERRRHRHHGVLPARGADLREAGHHPELWPLAAVALPGRRAVGRRQARLRDLRRVVEGHRRPVQEGRRCGSRARRQHEVGLLR